MLRTPKKNPCICLFVSVLESFRDYVTVESLDGDNKYDAGEHGLQVIIFVHSPRLTKVFEPKIVNIFIPISFNTCFGCSKEPSH